MKQIQMFYMRFSGSWAIALRGFPLLRFTFSNGWITIGSFRTKLQLSPVGAFPAVLGWFRFQYAGWWYYIRAVGRGIAISSQWKIEIFSILYFQ